MTTPDRQAIADLVAKYGSSSTTAWLEFERYKLWLPSEPVPESTFTPVQGYMEKDPYIFAWGNPLVSSPEALLPVARQFFAFAESQGKKLVWACVDYELEEILGSEDFGWSTVSCIYEDVVDPAHVLEMTSPEAKGKEGQHAVKDLKKNLARADKYEVQVQEVHKDRVTEQETHEVEQGIQEWKENKSGVQIASTTLQPWLDKEHRRYWLAKKDGKVVGILILTPIQDCSWQIKNAVSFPSAPKGTSEALIYTALKDLHTEQEQAFQAGEKIPHASNTVTTEAEQVKVATANGHPPSSATGASTPSSTLAERSTSNDSSASISSISSTPTTGFTSKGPSGSNGKHAAHTTEHRNPHRVTVTFGISAAPHLEPIHNMGGWKVNALSKTYGKVAKGAKLIQRGEFRSKFDSEAEAMYVCYPPDGFGLEGVNSLLKVLRK